MFPLTKQKHNQFKNQQNFLMNQKKNEDMRKC